MKKFQRVRGRENFICRPGFIRGESFRLDKLEVVQINKDHLCTEDTVRGVMKGDIGSGFLNTMV